MGWRSQYNRARSIVWVENVNERRVRGFPSRSPQRGNRVVTMVAKEGIHSSIGLDAAGLHVNGHVNVHWNLQPAELYEHAVSRGEGMLTNDGALRVLTGK